MPFLSLNGVKVSVAVDSVSMTYVGVGGDLARSPSGTLAGGPSVTKREWTMTTTPVPMEEVAAWTGLIEGAGHVWSFDADLYSSRGRGITQGGDVSSISLVGGGGQYDGYAAAADDAGTEAYFTVTQTNTWTLVGWSDSVFVGSWHHFLLTSTGVNKVDGVTASDADDLFAVNYTPGRVQFHTLTFGSFNVDDLVYLPYEMPAAWVSQIYAFHSASPWSALPRVTASGTFAPAPVTVRGKVTDTKAIHYSPDGTPTTGYTLEFTLKEV